MLNFWNFDSFWSYIRSAGGGTNIICYIGKAGCDGLVLQDLGYKVDQLVFGPGVLFVTKLEASIISLEGIPSLFKAGLSHLVVKIDRIYCTDGQVAPGGAQETIGGLETLFSLIEVLK